MFSISLDVKCLSEEPHVLFRVSVSAREELARGLCRGLEVTLKDGLNVNRFGISFSARGVSWGQNKLGDETVRMLGRNALGFTEPALGVEAREDVLLCRDSWRQLADLEAVMPDI